jgi:putative endopeptidase
MKKLVFISLGLIAFASCKTSKTESTTDKVSETTVSPNTELSTIDLSNMSNTIKPQDDFFLFSNENWIKTNPIPPSESRWGSFNELEKNNQEKLLQLLGEMANSNPKKGSDAQLLGDYFKSYLDMGKRQEAGLIIAKRDLEKINSMKSKAELVPVLAQQHINGISGLFNFGVGQDLKNVDKNISYLSQGGISLPNKEYYVKADKRNILDQYQTYMIELMLMFGIDSSQVKRTSQNVLDIEIALAGSMYAPAEMRAPEKTYNKRSLEDTKKLFGDFDFEKYLVEIGSSSADTLIVGNPEFIKTVSNLIAENKIGI